MKLVANEINNYYFRNIPEYAKNATSIDLAVAYITDDHLFNIAREHQIPFRIWCRIDEEVSLKTLEILEKNLWYPKCQVFATHDFLHSKVLWFHGVGCYIGSANLTSKALHNNIELGVFFYESSDDTDFFQEIKTFFESLPNYTSRILLDDIKRIRKVFEQLDKDSQISEANKHLRNLKEKYLHEWKKLKEGIFRDQKVPLRQFSKTSQHQKRIIDEWKNCQKLLTNYTEIYRKKYSRPNWVSPDVPYFAELDKMFDWYYSVHIQGDQRVEILVEEHHQKNQGNPDEKIKALFTIWSNLKELPYEWITESFNARVPTVKDLLRRDRIKQLNSDEIAQVVFHCYALMDHIDQFKSYSDLRLEKTGNRVAREIKAKQFVTYFLTEPNKHGKTFLEILSYFIWDDTAPPWEKIWECTALNSKWKYPGIDKSTLGELIGLARPDEYPVRNNRISRVLYALGFDVDHF